jgi:hypothetical protein
VADEPALLSQGGGCDCWSRAGLVGVGAIAEVRGRLPCQWSGWMPEVRGQESGDRGSWSRVTALVTS